MTPQIDARLSAVWDNAAMRKTLEALDSVAQYMDVRFPTSVLNRMATYALQYLRAETPLYNDRFKRRPHNRPGGNSSPTIRSQWVQSKLQKVSGDQTLKSIFNKKALTPHGKLVLEVLEGGSRAHAIPLEPKTDDSVPSFLSFYWEAIGEFVVARQVFHPGTKPYKMTEKTYHRLLFLIDQMQAIASGEAMAAFRNPTKTHSSALMSPRSTGVPGLGLRL